MLPKPTIYKIIASICTAILTIAAAILSQSCTATRTIVNDCSCVKSADSTSIHCEVIEKYVGRKNIAY